MGWYFFKYLGQCLAQDEGLINTYIAIVLTVLLAKGLMYQFKSLMIA